MWLEWWEKFIHPKNFVLTPDEIKIAKEQILNSRNNYDQWILELEKPVEKHRDFIRQLEEHYTLDKGGFMYDEYILKKAIVIMQENWAKSIDEFDTIFSKTSVLIYGWGRLENQDIQTIHNNIVYSRTEEVNYDKIAKESVIKQEKDLNEALLLSEEIKSGEI